MGGGDNEITIKTLLDPSGFVKGSKQLQAAVKSLGNAAKSVGGNAKSAFSGLLSTARRLAPMIIGVGSAFQVISRAVHAFMAENQELSAKMSSIWSSLGNILGPIITQVINWVSTAVSLFIQFLSLLGISVKQSKNAAKAAGGAASELKKTIAGFDELNTLTDNSGGGGGGGAGNKELDPAELPDWLKKLANALKNKLWDEAADIIINKFNELIKKFKEKAYEWGKKCGEYFAAAVHMIARFIKEADWKGIGQGIADFIDGLFEDVDPKELGLILVGKFVIAFKILVGFLENLDWKQLAVKISGILVGALEGIGDAIRSADSKKIGENIREFFKNIKWGEIREAFKNLLKTAVQEAIDLLWGVLNLPGDPPNFWKNLSVEKIAKSLTVIVKQAVKDVVSTLWTVVGLPDTPEGFWKNINKETLQGELSEKISSAVQGAVGGLWDAINMPGEPPQILESINSIIESLSTLASEIGTFVRDAFNGTLKVFLDYDPGNGEKSGIALFIENMASAFSALIDAIANTGIGDLLSTIWGTLSKMQKAAFTVGSESIPEFIKQLAGAIEKIPASTTLSTLVENLGRFYTEFLLPCSSLVIKSGVFGSFFDSIVTFFTVVGDVINLALPGLLQFLNDFVLPFVELNLTAISGFFTGMAQLFENLHKVITGEISFGEMLDNLWNAAYGENKVETLNQSFDGLQDSIWGATSNLNELYVAMSNADEETEYASNATESFKQSMDGVVDTLTSQVEGLDGAGAATEELKKKVAELTEEWIKKAEADANVFGNANAMVELQEQLTQVTQEYKDALAEQGIIIEENGEIIQKTAGAVEDQAAAQEKAAAGLVEAAEANEKSNEILEKTPEATGEAATGYNDLSTEVDESCGDIVNTTDTTASETESTMKDWGSQMVTIVGDATKEIRDDFESGTTEMGQIASAATQDMNSVFAHNFAIIANNAYLWGQHIIINLNDGIMSLVGQFEGNIASLAAMIRAYLGFSEPEKGPLSNFHTFMPDMMKLLSKGIEDNMPLARRAAEDVANAISSSLKAGDYDISAIADNVAFSMPAVAGGGVLPYGIDGSWDGISKGSDDSALIAAVDDLRQLVISFQNTMENMEFVAQFGDVRALAKSITRVQKQMERASG